MALRMCIVVGVLAGITSACQAQTHQRLSYFNGTNTIQLGQGPSNVYATMAGDTIAWRIREGSTNSLYLHQGGTTTQLPDPATGLTQFLDMAGRRLAWTEGGDAILYDLDSGMRTNMSAAFPGFNVGRVHVSETSAAWTAQQASFMGEVFLFDGATATRITNDTVDDFVNGISGSNAVWRKDQGTNAEVFMTKNGQVVQLTDNDVSDFPTGIFGNSVVYQRGTFDELEVFLHTDAGTTQLTNNAVNDSGAHIWEERVAWHSANGVKLFDGTTIHDVPTPSTIYSGNMALNGNTLAWSALLDGNYEVFMYNGTSTVQITDNDLDDLVIDVGNGTVLWSTRVAVPEPGGLVALGALSLLLARRRRAD